MDPADKERPTTGTDGARAFRLWPAAQSLRGQLMLVVLLTTLIALLISATALLLADLSRLRSAWAAELEAEAGILALATTPALAFDDREAARLNLATLAAQPAIEQAVLYAADGRLFAQYSRGGTASPPSLPARQNGTWIDGERVSLVRPVEQNGEQLGTLYIEASYDVAGRVGGYVLILGGVMLLSLTLALLASGWLQRRITRPMDSMTNVAHGIIDRGDYSLRAHSTDGGELGLLVNAFNRMLDEIESRARALETANEALTREIAARKETERALVASEQLYRAIGESIEYGVWICDAAGNNLYASDSFLRLAGMTQEECSSLGWTSILHPDDREATTEAWLDCVRRGTPWYREHRVLGTDGRYHHVLAQGVPIRDAEGNVTRWAGINLDIGRMKRTEEALREADRRKDEFLATLAHELRNPLAPIRNAVQILGTAAADERQRQWGQDVIARQVRHMALLLDDLLDVSRITRGKLDLRKSPVDLDEVISGAIEIARPLIESRQHALMVHAPSEKVTVEVDPLRVSQVLGNLLTNAAKYTDPGGRITLRTSVDGENLIVSVADTGIGLARDSLPRLFTMFSQVSGDRERAEGGLGIGLALVKGLVELHGGSVTVRSEGPGRGSEFTVRLPGVVTATSRLEPKPAAPAANRPEAAVGVLIADDNRDAADTFGALLRLSGYTVLTAFSGLEALAIAEERRPRVIFLDIGMPDLDGCEVARRIRAQDWGREIVLVALTGWGQEADRQRSAAAGFDHHYTKPVDPDDLEDILGLIRTGTTA